MRVNNLPAMGMLCRAKAKPFAIVGCSFAFAATITCAGLALACNEREQAAVWWMAIVVFSPSLVLCSFPHILVQVRMHSY